MIELTPKQENFCLAYLETGNASEAYRRAYNASKMKEAVINVKACELLANGKVTVRLAELRKPIIERHQITVDDLIAELEQARKIALSALSPQASASVAATMGKAKLLGYGIEKHEHTGANGGAILVDTAARQARLLELQTKLIK